MIEIIVTDTLAEIVNRHPALMREFERLGIDYCCGGGRTFADACRDVGLDAVGFAEVLARAVEPHPVPDWVTSDAPALVRHLVETHHAYLWDELPRLSVLAAKVLAVHGDAHPELAAIVATYEEIRADLEPHLMKEERILFPMVLELCAAEGPVEFHCGTLKNPIGVMLREHDAVGDLLKVLRRLTAGYRVPADACASYAGLYAGLQQLEADTHEHIHKENNVLFPVVERTEAALAGR